MPGVVGSWGNTRKAGEYKEYEEDEEWRPFWIPRAVCKVGQWMVRDNLRNGGHSVFLVFLVFCSSNNIPVTFFAFHGIERRVRGH